MLGVSLLAVFIDTKQFVRELYKYKWISLQKLEKIFKIEIADLLVWFYNE